MRPDIQGFIDNIRGPAQAIESETGIPWRFAMVQAAHESGYGQSRLALMANNLFGFTASADWMDEHRPTVKFLTRECSAKPPDQIRYWDFPGDIFSKARTPSGGSELQVWRYFRKYDSWEASLRDWATLMQRTHYAAAYAAAKAGDFAGFAQGLEEAGYATDTDPRTGKPDYARQLVALNAALADIA